MTQANDMRKCYNDSNNNDDNDDDDDDDVDWFSDRKWNLFSWFFLFPNKLSPLESCFTELFISKRDLIVSPF